MEKTNLTTKYISHLELGNRNPSLETFIKIANALEISADLLLFDLVDCSYAAKNSFLDKKISNLSMENQKFIHSVIDTMINEMEEK